MGLNNKESFGQYLRRERVLREITLEEIANFTKIKISTLTSLENDDYDHLPSIAFVRGFVRAYAEHLGLNVSEVMLRFTSFIEANHPEILVPDVKAKSVPRIRRPLMMGLFLILVLGFFFYSYQYMRSLEEKTPSGSPAEPELKVETAQSDTLAYHDAENQAPEKLEGAAEKSTGPYKIQLTATELCWVQAILDGETPKEATLYPGDSIRYEAKQGIRLLIGNAGGIRIKYDGKVIENPGPSGRPIRLSFPQGERKRKHSEQ
jgi:cytoskeleton protein RodZ